MNAENMFLDDLWTELPEFDWDFQESGLPIDSLCSALTVITKTQGSTQCTVLK
jgi:hypothetical protein